MVKNIHPPYQGRVASRFIAAGLLFTCISGLTGLTNMANAQSAPTVAATHSMAKSSALTLHQAIALALSGNLDLQVAKRELEATEGQVLQAQVRPNPELAYMLEDPQAQTRTQTVQINLPVEMGGKRAARIAAAERGRDIAVEDFNLRNIEIRSNVLTAFFACLAAQERVALAEDSLNLAKNASDAVAKRVAAGKLSPLEESKARVAAAGTRIELAQALSEQHQALSSLNNLLGNHAHRYTRVSAKIDALPAVPDIAHIEQRLADSPALRRAQLEIERRLALTELERNKRIPDLTLSMGIKRTSEQRNQWLFGLSMPLPLFERNQGNLREALTREDKARDELQAHKLRAHSEALQARERFFAMRTEVDMLQQDVLPGAKHAYEAASIGFENGKFNFLEVLDAQRSYFSAKSQYIKAMAQTLRAATELERALGIDFMHSAKPE